MLINNLETDAKLRELFPRMKPDKILLEAKKYPLICAFAARYIKIQREKHFSFVASRKMRELAKLTFEVKI